MALKIVSSLVAALANYIEFDKALDAGRAGLAPQKLALARNQRDVFAERVERAARGDVQATRELPWHDAEAEVRRRQRARKALADQKRRQREEAAEIAAMLAS